MPVVRWKHALGGWGTQPNVGDAVQLHMNCVRVPEPLLQNMPLEAQPAYSTGEQYCEVALWKQPAPWLTHPDVVI